MIVIVFFLLSIILLIHFLYEYYNIRVLITIFYFNEILSYSVISEFDILILQLDVLDDLDFREIANTDISTVIYNSSNCNYIYKHVSNNIIRYRIITPNEKRYIVHPRLNIYIDEIFNQLINRKKMSF